MKLIALEMTPLEPKWLRSDLTQRLRSHLTQHAGMGSEAKVIELAGGKSGHLKLWEHCIRVSMSVPPDPTLP